MIFEMCRDGVKPFRADWQPSEIELENYLVFQAEGATSARTFDASIFGEELLLLERQVMTKQAKRADLVALDQAGNSVFIELKKHEARQGIETQALQYLANFANLKGDNFLRRFGAQKDAVREFLGDAYD